MSAALALPERRRGSAGMVYAWLREEILAGRLRPGQALSENEVAQRLSVSRTPVREAIIRLEGVCRVRMQREHATTHHFREVAVTPLPESRPNDSHSVAVLRAQVERIARYCGEDGESLVSLLSLDDPRVFLYTLTAFLPSLELLVAGQGDPSTDRSALVALQQQSLAAADADARVRFLIERTSGIVAGLGRQCVTPTSLLN